MTARRRDDALDALESSSRAKIASLPAPADPQQQQLQSPAVPRWVSDSSTERKSDYTSVLELGLEVLQGVDEAVRGDETDEDDEVTAMMERAAAQGMAGHVDEALRLYEEVIELHNAKIGGSDDVFASRVMLKVHSLLDKAGRVDEAAARLLRARALLVRAGEYVPELTARHLRAKARESLAAGQPEQAAGLCEQAVQLLLEHRDELPGELAAAQVDLACARADQARLEESVELILEAMPAVETISDVWEKRVVSVRAAVLVAKSLEACGNVSQAAYLLHGVVERQRVSEAKSPGRAGVLLALAKLKLRMENHDEAVELLNEAAAVLSATPRHHPSQVELAIVRAAVDEADAALEKLNEVQVLLMNWYDDELHPAVLRVRLAKSTARLRETPSSPAGVGELVDALALLGLTVEWDACELWSAPERQLEARHVGVAVELLRAYAAAQLQRRLPGAVPALSAAVLAYKTALEIVPAESSLRVLCLVELARVYVFHGRSNREVQLARTPLRRAMRLMGDELLGADCTHASLLQVQLLWALARVVSASGEGVDVAVPHFRQAMAQVDRLPEFVAHERAALYHDAGEALVHGGEDSFEEGMELLVRAIKSYDKMGRVGEQARCLKTVGCALQRVGRWQEAALSLQRASKLSSEAFGPTWRTVEVTLVWARVLVHLGNHTQAQQVLMLARDQTHDASLRAHILRALEDAKPRASLWQRFRRALPA